MKRKREERMKDKEKGFEIRRKEHKEKKMRKDEEKEN